MDFLDVTDHLFLRSTKTRQDELRWFGPDPGAYSGGPGAEKGGMWILKLMGELDKKWEEPDVTAARLQYVTKSEFNSPEKHLSSLTSLCRPALHGSTCPPAESADRMKV